VRAGDLRHRAKLQQQVDTQDSFGQAVQTWATLATIWCQISPLSGREALIAQQVQSEITHQVICRYRPELAVPKAVATYRLLFGARVFNITSSVNKDERNREITLMATEGLTDG
jgi:SPP1 family predicted phage head-tail adaptor